MNLSQSVIGSNPQTKPKAQTSKQARRAQTKQLCCSNKPLRVQAIKEKSLNLGDFSLFICIYAKKVVNSARPASGFPPNVRSRPAVHMQRRVFFVQPNGFRISLPYISSYASIAAIYRHKIHKILFYWTKNTRKFAYVQFL